MQNAAVAGTVDAAGVVANVADSANINVETRVWILVVAVFVVTAAVDFGVAIGFAVVFAVACATKII